ncbi:hypothetical protein MNBD_BACTEROID06-257 [hydrothermal vent metagenome]|uniref:Uncharacterized protein n=1 Tax=hydrothermal vent metagenome TaxID=652676 RepID=A0A3B0V9R1_9ZZZZ
MSIYLDRYAYPPLALQPPTHANTGIIIVIPVFNEKHTTTALNSLLVSDLPDVNTEVLIIINQSIECDAAIEKQNSVTLNEIRNWIKSNTKAGIQFYVTKIDLPKKHAGVGLARKAGMDEAVRRFEKIGNEKGIILCYDADCTCSSNYIKEVYSAFCTKQLKGASINFKHLHKELTPKELNGIIQYELHLRYYVNALRKAGYPYAFHTIGSSMAVRTDIYKKAGGMNKRKAGEDFHFLHKVIPYGSYDEITGATVYPSSRVSDRVPFGTGKAMNEWLKKNEKHLYSYHPEIFKEIAQLLQLVPTFYGERSPIRVTGNLSEGIKSYLSKEKFESVCKDIQRQSNNLPTFIHRWYNWFNGLKALHLVHFLRDHYYPSITISKAASQLINSDMSNPSDLLAVYQKMDTDFKADQISLQHLYF